MIDFNMIITNVFAVIGGLYTILKVVAPITKWKGDDKMLAVINKISEYVNITSSKTELEIKIKTK